MKIPISELLTHSRALAFGMPVYFLHKGNPFIIQTSYRGPDISLDSFLIYTVPVFIDVPVFIETFTVHTATKHFKEVTQISEETYNTLINKAYLLTR